MLLQTTGGFSRDVFDEPMFPLGAWCATSDKKSELAASEFNSRQHINVDLESAQIIKKFERLVYPALNDFHGLNFPNSFWKNSLGTYIRMLVPLLVTRYEIVCSAVENQDFTQFTMIEVDPEAIIPNDRTSMLTVVNSHAWNHYIFGVICESVGLTPRRPLTKISLPSPVQSAARDLHPERRTLIKEVMAAACNAVATRSRVLISRTMLPRRTELLLAIRHRTLPLFWSENVAQSTVVNRKLRDELGQLVSSSLQKDHLILQLAISQIPRVFVEDFKAVWHSVNRRLPRKPRVVFTANLHHASDAFLLWLSAAQVEGTKVVIAQHGGVHSLCRDVPGDIQSEREFADRYITWGPPTFPSQSAVPGPVLVNIGAQGQAGLQTDRDSLLLVLDWTYRYPSIPRGMNGDRYSYAILLNSFIEQLDPKTIKNIVIRPYRGSELLDDSLIALLAQDPRIQIDDRFPPIQDLLNTARLVVTTSLGTTLFQTIHQDIPTLILLDPSLSPVSREAEHALVGLRNGSVLFHDPVQTALQANACFREVERWWKSTETRRAIRSFRETLSPTSADPIAFYSGIISSMSTDREKS